jgi:hypothetical protein
MREGQGMMDKSGQKILQESHIPLIRKADFFDRSEQAVDSVHS